MFASASFCQAPLTTAADVKRLSAEQAKSAPPVVLTGVITQVVPEWWAFSLQDRTDGVYVASSGPLAADVQVGRTVRVYGEVMRGNFAPSVRASRISLLPG